MKFQNMYPLTRTIRRNGFRLLLLSLIALLSAPALTTARNVDEFAVVPLSGPDGVVLVIGGPMLHPSTAAANNGWIGYHIYRRQIDDTAAVRITETPLSRPGSLAELEAKMGGNLEGFERFAGLTGKEELWQAIERNDTAIVPISFLSKNFRRALGLMLTDTEVEPNVSYQYWATLVAQDGAESKPSEPMDVTFGVPLYSLLGPLSINGQSTEDGVALSWIANPDDSGAFSYSVYRCPDSIGAFLRLNLAALTLDIDSASGEIRGSFLDTTAQPGRTWYYTVVSTDYAGNESPRKPLLPINPVDLSRPPIPQNVFANPTDLGLTLIWDTVPGPVAGYNVYRSTDPDSNYTRLNTILLPPDTGFFEDKSTTLVDRYFYRVTAVGENGRESEQSARALSLYENRLAPTPPQDVEAEPHENGILIRWQPNEEPDLFGYYVFRADGYNGALSQVSPLINPDTTEYLDTAHYVSPGGQYWYLVQAINFTGVVSSFSIPVAARTSRVDSPDAPRSFFGYPDDLGARLFWRCSDNNATTGYHLYRALEADSLTWKRLTTQPLSRTTGEFTDTTAAVGTVYLYQIRAINDRGDESAPSHNLRLVMHEPAPLPPGGVRVAADGAALKIVWNKTLQSSATGYRIYRRTDTEPATLLTTPSLPATVAEYHDTSVQSGVRYYYAVSCIDRYGHEGAPSAEVSYLRE